LFPPILPVILKIIVSSGMDEVNESML